MARRLAEAAGAGQVAAALARFAARFPPMKAEKHDELPRGPGWIYEPKWDGIRIVAAASATAARLLSANGNDKTAQFPEVAAAASALAAAAQADLVLDGELVAVSEAGAPLRFGALQPRIHVGAGAAVERLRGQVPVVLQVFDLLVRGARVLLDEPLAERRAALAQLLGDAPGGALRLGDADADADAMLRRARERGWEGLVAKRLRSVYQPGRRSGDWVKYMLHQAQEFVVGGYTLPRGARRHFGSLLLGYYDHAGRLIYAGSVGTGFDRATLAGLARRLARIERKRPPFADPPRAEGVRWTSPQLVVQVEFNQWTAAGRIRQARYRGLRDDRTPRSVVREPGTARSSVDSG